MGDQFLALSYAISRYVEGKGPDKTFKELDEETQEFFRGLQPALFEINRRYTAHMWEKMDLLEKKWAKQGKSKDEIVIKLKKILPDHMHSKWNPFGVTLRSIQRVLRKKLINFFY